MRRPGIRSLVGGAAGIAAGVTAGVVLTAVSGAPRLLRNDQRTGHHWLRLALTGTRANRDGIGSVIEVQVGQETLRRPVMPVRGYLSQSELPVTIGLGDRTSVDRVRIRWADGSIQDVERVAIDATTRIVQPGS